MFETLVLGQMIRKYANSGRRENIYFYRDHQGLEIDFVIPVGDKLRLFECKYQEDPQSVKIFKSFKRSFGESKVLSESVITPNRNKRVSKEGYKIIDCVELSEL